ncbi:MAG: cutinase family protein [Candidatus Nomurabacteria bacterium]|jgi:hypothetical protein|nr:cutinase family protein [Candidatus Nomurabacteria bacterium]
MKKLLQISAALTPILLIFGIFSASPKTYGENCDDLKFIFARGSGGTPNADKEFIALKTGIDQMMSQATTPVKYSVFDLGSDPSVETIYKDIKIFPSGLHNLNILKDTAGAFISGGEAFRYGASVASGEIELIDNITNTLKTCPQTRFVLSGFSQGAQVVGETLRQLTPTQQDKIIYVALFGDPKLYLPEGEGIDPPACHGVNLSVYNVYTGNCRTSSGSLGARNPYLPDNLRTKTGLWCTNNDFVCGGVENLPALSSCLILPIPSPTCPTDILAVTAHGEYVERGHVSWILAKIRSHLKQYFQRPDGETIFADNYTPEQRAHNEASAPYDIAIFADLSNLKTVAQQNDLENQIRSFLQLLPQTSTTRISFFNSSFSTSNVSMYCNNKINDMSIPDNALNCIANHLYNERNFIPDKYQSTDYTTVLNYITQFTGWHTDSAHSIVIFTDNKSAAIPPDFSLVSNDIQLFSNLSLDYAQLAELQIRPIAKTTFSRLCLGACKLTVGLANASVGEPFTIDASPTLPISEPIDHYEFDFADGTTIISSEPFASHIYTTYGTFLAQVRAITKSGRIGVTIIRVTVSASAAQPIAPSPIPLTNLDFTPNSETNSGVLSWEIAPSRARAATPNLILRLNNFILGQIDPQLGQIIITDLDFSEDLTFNLGASSITTPAIPSTNPPISDFSPPPVENPVQKPVQNPQKSTPNPTPSEPNPILSQTALLPPISHTINSAPTLKSPTCSFECLQKN